MDGQRVVITGATSGIGRATAVALAKLGANLLLVSRDRAKGTALARQLSTASTRAEFVEADLSSLTQVRRAANQIRERSPTIDVLINNAGARFDTFASTPDHFERWFNLGVAEQKRNHLPEAVKAYGEAVRIRPDAKQAHVNLGIVKQESGDLKGAREGYERALQIAPDQGDVIYNLASVIEQQGEKEEAERLYVKLLRATRIGKTRGFGWAIYAWSATITAAASKPSRPASASARRGPRRS